MRRVVAFALGAVLAALLSVTSATAQCEVGTSPGDSFRAIDARGGAYVMAVGVFSDGPVLDEIFALAADGSETSTRIVAGRFAGHAATSEGFVNALETDLDIAQRCTAQRCHPRLDGTRYLVFLERVRGRLRYTEETCVTRAFAEPDDTVLATMIACMNGQCP